MTLQLLNPCNFSIFHVEFNSRFHMSSSMMKFHVEDDIRNKRHEHSKHGKKYENPELSWVRYTNTYTIMHQVEH